MFVLSVGLHSNTLKSLIIPHKQNFIFGESAIDNMPTITIEDVYKEIKKLEKEMITKSDLDSMAETMEILANSNTMETLRKSDEDIKKGRTKKIDSVKDLIKEV